MQRRLTTHNSVCNAVYHALTYEARMQDAPFQLQNVRSYGYRHRNSEVLNMLLQEYYRKGSAVWVADEIHEGGGYTSQWREAEIDEIDANNHMSLR